ncbi:MAG TPA: flagellar biosynthetic protein FliO [Hyphomicrobiaceae bacterium]|nr:flagellar biosynthetic protein FliO [Hyphomicrobiaceae bacterium]
MLFYFFILVVVAALALAAIFAVRSYLDGSAPGSGLFGPRAERRLAVVDQASVDGRRRLILVRRDDVEHLIMTGGPVDVVIETGIGAPKAAAVPAPSTVYARQPRPFGQTAATASATAASDRAAE